MRERGRRRRRSRMGVTWLQTDESVREGYWIHSPPGNAGHSLNDDEQPRYLVWISHWHTSRLKQPFLSGSNNAPWVLTASSTSANICLRFGSCRKSFLANLVGWLIRWLSFLFSYIMVQKDPVLTHNATMLLFGKKVAFPSVLCLT